MAWSQAFRRQNYSFMEHVANRERTGVGYRYLLEQARKGAGGWKLLKKGRASQQTEWVDAQVKKYLTKERQFLRKLMVCMHVMGEYCISLEPGSIGMKINRGCRWAASAGTRIGFHKDQQ
jgi:hypothetical protein